VGPTELREFLGLPDVASVQQEALDALVHKLRSGAASGSDALAVLRGMVPEGLTSIGEWQRLLGRALQTGRPVTVETTVTPRHEDARGASARRTTGGRQEETRRQEKNLVNPRRRAC
jgi:hypothetical protein